MIQRRWTESASLILFVFALTISSAAQVSSALPRGVQRSDCPPSYFARQHELEEATAARDRSANADPRSDVSRLRRMQIDILTDLVNTLNSQIEDCVNRRFAASCVGVAKISLEYSDSRGKKRPDYQGAQMFFQRACDAGDKGSCKKAQDAAKKAGQSK
jgi:hypothetical protein